MELPQELSAVLDNAESFLNESQMFFLLCIVVIAGGMIWYIHNTLSKILNKRLKRVGRILRMDPMHTDLLTDKDKEKQKEVIAEQVDSRFTIIRRFIIGTIIVFAVLVGGLPFFGNLPATAISLLLTGVTVLLGIAARPFIENIFSGIVISLSNQIRIGDTLLLDGQYGTVEDILVTHTRIKTWDWKRYLIPNSRMLTKEFVNLTLKEKKNWCYLEFSVSYNADLEKVESIACSAANSSEHHLPVDSPQFWVLRMEKDALICWVAAWAATPSEAWGLRSDMAKYIFKALQQENIATNINNLSFSSFEKTN